MFFRLSAIWRRPTFCDSLVAVRQFQAPHQIPDTGEGRLEIVEKLSGIDIELSVPETAGGRAVAQAETARAIPTRTAQCVAALAGLREW